MTPQTHAQIEELLGAYALDAVDPDEAAVIEEHLETCPRCRAEVSDHREVAAMLGNTGGPAPDGVWERIAGALEDTPPPLRMPELPDDVVVPLRLRKRPLGGPWVLAAAAVAIVVAGLVGLLIGRADRDGSELPSSDELASMEGAAVARMAGDGPLDASAVVLPDGTGYLLVDELPDLDPDRAYQLWGIAGENVVSLGVLGAEPNDVMPFSAGGQLDAVAITEEVAGGVVQSEQDPLLVGEFD